MTHNLRDIMLAAFRRQEAQTMDDEEGATTVEYVADIYGVLESMESEQQGFNSQALEFLGAILEELQGIHNVLKGAAKRAETEIERQERIARDIGKVQFE